eukprot:TRINITY_DN2867_c0_g1_i3.p1 TRINITY_DN2867_c0_g1~~TRINITY_DN2867_c0_g1_i3.p1  ORF type:complete len:317 (+),score=48.15 TRINITY_DN2867_c0_g1_i3:26-952(+)
MDGLRTNNSDQHDYWFELDDQENWMEYLNEQGYVVLKQVASTLQVETAIDLYWHHYQQLLDVDRNNIDTWQDWYLDRRGIQTKGPTIQSEAAWFIRGLPNVKQAFATIWDTEELIVSMDSLIIWKPWWLDDRWLPVTEGLHIDQNPFSKPEKLCVQGMMPLYEVTPEIGGLEVVPGSNNRVPEFRHRYPKFKGSGDFCVLANNDPMQGNGKLVLAEPGDLILWDSRTVHGGLVGNGEVSDTEPRLARLSQTVCMVPRSRASNKVLSQRKKGFEKGWGFTHWPNEDCITSLGSRSYEPIELSPEQLDLL